jgi:hypothetical protein
LLSVQCYYPYKDEKGNEFHVETNNTLTHLGSTASVVAKLNLLMGGAFCLPKQSSLKLVTNEAPVIL